MTSWRKPKPGDFVIGGGRGGWNDPDRDRYTGIVTQVVKVSRVMTLVQIDGKDTKTGETGLFWLFAGQLRRLDT